MHVISLTCSFRKNGFSVRREVISLKKLSCNILRDGIVVPGCPVFSKCSERSQPKTRSLRMPDFFNFPRLGRLRIKLRKNEMSLPCFRRTGFETGSPPAARFARLIRSRLLHPVPSDPCDPDDPDDPEVVEIPEEVGDRMESPGPGMTLTEASVTSIPSSSCSPVESLRCRRC